MKKKVIIRAPLLSYSGYGTHARQIFRWLLSRTDIEVSTQVVPWGCTSWMINPETEGGLAGEIMKRSVAERPSDIDVSIQLQLPNEWDPTLAAVNVGLSAVVETDICNPSWVECCNKMTAIIVPSNHAKSVINKSEECKVPLHVVPECYYSEIAAENIDSFDLELDTDFNFLVFGQFTGNDPHTDRKNLFNTIKLLCDTFRDDDNVGIVLKTNSGKNTTVDRAITEKILRQLVKEVRKGSFPKIHLLHGRLTQKQVASLYRHPKIKALVSLTRGEGYGLPLLEAAASGLPILATNWSGHLDFLKHGKFIPINYQLRPIPKSRIDGSIFIEGARWAEPSEEHACQRLRKFHKSSLIPKKWAMELKDKIIPLYSQDAINGLYNNVLDKYLI
tara:strand:- start:189 stop:1355 length:1167 start_codon:yes stop_codon:yes gene_type:complete